LGGDASAGDGASDGTLDVALDGYGGGDSSDVATGDDGSAAEAGCSGMATRQACMKCCRMGNASGFRTLVTTELGCACTPALCGAPEGGTDAAPPSLDAGPDVSFFGIGACTASCGSTPTPADQECTRCIDETLGTKAGPGPCASEVRDACAGDPACVAYEMCTKGCP
jgi:hypothetical protein